MVSIILSLVIQVLLASIIVTLYFMHSFITILKVLIPTKITLLTSFAEKKRIGNSGQPVELAWDLSPASTINTIDQREATQSQQIQIHFNTVKTLHFLTAEGTDC